MLCWTAAGMLVLAACQQAEEEAGIEENEEEESAGPEEENEREEEGEDVSTEPEEENEEPKEETPEPVYTLNENDWSLEPIDDAEEEAVLITIDDAPDEYAVEMAETLDELDVAAIFFINHHFINDEEGEEQLLDILEHGHELGNHTMTHANLQEITEEEVEDEIVDLNDEIERITGERPDFFRAPFGANTDRSWEVVEEEGMLGMNWTYGFDWEEEYTEPDALAEMMVETELLQNGANLLMHDREWTNDALEDIIIDLEAEGYDFIDPAEIELENE
ncbi:polysaccharide deacetylase family protein [Salicibibacter halophilus]|uniref:Polysaccharide deacetylase family protein n=2 Tax=Salicibibacter halophilus TaxID=2502791 RepID=A0A514LMG1_9BACI|nr:polysaccharide deacetylase family protein [Salicibibacter halophilus]